MKKWLLRKKHQIELARKRGWKGYWVCLKGTTLLFYPCDSREGRSVEAAPKHLIIVDGAIMQPIPEHPKRDYIFCLSTAFGDAYLFQAPCQVNIYLQMDTCLSVPFSPLETNTMYINSRTNINIHVLYKSTMLTEIMTDKEGNHIQLNFYSICLPCY